MAFVVVELPVLTSFLLLRFIFLRIFLAILEFFIVRAFLVNLIVMIFRFVIKLPQLMRLLML